MQTFKKLLGLVLMISLLVITGCEKQAPTTESPDKVLLKMQEQYQKKKTENKKGQTEGLFTFKINTAEMDISASGNVDMAVDGTDINNPKVEINLNLKGEGSGEEMESNAKIDLSMRLLKQMLYLKLNELELNSEEDPGVAQQVQMMSAFIANKWFKIPLPENQGLSPMNISGPLSLNSSQLTEEQVKQIEELAKTIQIFKFVEDLGSGNGKYYYKVTLHNENVIKFIKKMTEIMEVELTNEDQDEIKEIFQITETSVEFIIDSKTFELNEIKNGEISIKSPESNEETNILINANLSEKKTEMGLDVTINADGEETKINVTLDLNTNPDAKVNIEEPADAQEFDPMMMGGMMAPDLTGATQ